MKVNSSEFDPNHFVNPAKYEEGPLQERKEIIKFKHEEDKAEFLRDVIALYNTSIWFNRYAYLLIGLDNNGNPKNVMPQILQFDNEQLPEEEFKKWEKLRHKISEIIRNYIEPNISWKLEHGEIHGEQVCYLILSGCEQREFAKVRKEIKTRKGIRVGDSWIRFGESKGRIDFKELSYFEENFSMRVPYISPSNWLAYIDDQMKNINRPAINDEIPFYQQLEAKSGGMVADKIEEFLNSDDNLLYVFGNAGCGKSVLLRKNAEKILIAFQQACEKCKEREEYNLPKSNQIPLFIELREVKFKNLEELTKVLTTKITFNASYLKPKAIQSIFEETNLHWLILLDGLDELLAKGIGHQKVLDAIKSFVDKYQNVKIIVTSRPDINGPETTSKTRCVEIKQLRNEQVDLAFSQQLDRDDLGQILDRIHQDPDLNEMVKIPLFLSLSISAFVDTPTLLENFQPVSKAEPKPQNLSEVNNYSIPEHSSITVDEFIQSEKGLFESQEANSIGEGLQANFEQDKKVHEPPPSLYLENLKYHLISKLIASLINREVNRDYLGNNERDEFEHQIEKLAITTDGKLVEIPYEEVKKYIKNKKFVCLTQNTGVLLKDNHKGSFHFVNIPAKAYFAARWINPYLNLPNCAQKKRYIKNITEDFKKEILMMLSELEFRENLSELLSC